MRQYSVLVTVAALLAVIYYSCSPPPNSDESPVEVPAQPVMRKVSELVTLMFSMEADMKTIRLGLLEDSSFTPLESLTYSNLFTSETSKDVKLDSVFVVNGHAYLRELNALTSSDNKDSAIFYFNNAVVACVQCHQEYCPGPIARIKKLRIN